jgi:hypothetical protein
MIVSASYRTDIPAFFGAWFAERWAAGYATVPNPYSSKLTRIGLTPEECDGIVFWTRWATPFMENLDRVFGDGVPFVVQYTATGLGPEIEPGVPDWRRAAENMHRITERYGTGRVVWRFDPIVVREGEDWEETALRFAAIADAVKGATDEAVISFTQFYAKSKRALGAHASSGGPKVIDPDADTKRRILGALREITHRADLKLSLCGQPDLIIPGVSEAACIDADRMSAVAGHKITAKNKPHRSTCRCAQSRDIGTFATCKFGCRYCYAA